MSTQLTIQSDQKYWTDTQISALKQLGLTNAGSGDLAFFFHQAQRTGLDPFARQIYMIERGGRYGIQTSIDGLRIVAQRSGEYAGQTAPYWCGEDGNWRDVWLAKTPPLAAKIGVYRVGFSEPTWGVARLDSYCPLGRDGKPMGLWNKMPDVMLAKCAEALALRKAFPNDMSGLYTDDEMSQADAVVVVEQPKPKKIDLAIVNNKTTGKSDSAVVITDWDAIDSELELLKTKDEIKEYWFKKKLLLDEMTPWGGTLREILVDKANLLTNATADK